MNYIVETSLGSDGPAIFPLADLSQLYQQPLEQLGIVSPTVNATRWKEKLLAEIPELEAHKKGKGVLLALQRDVAQALSQASDYSDALVIAKAAKILRRKILEYQSKFDGTFGEGCIKDAIPQKRKTDFEVSITSQVPLLRDQAHSVATVKHSMQKVSDAVAHLNLGQVPNITADQPIYALAKQVQWQ